MGEIRQTTDVESMAPSRKKERWMLITGGAGFIGTNLAHRILSEGRPVLILDNLSRPGVEKNLNWLCDTHGDLVRVEVADICDSSAMDRAVTQADAVFHFAAQVAVTTSIDNPLLDFDVNVQGTFNLLESIRRRNNRPPLVFTSTNKVYGKLGNLKLIQGARRYEPADGRLRESGINENFPLDFRSPYGCSKGAADQYVLDYSRIYRIPATVFRMSCIYGPHQFGTEDQGWVAHFLIQALSGKPIVLYGDGCQVRDILFVEDLVDALLTAREYIGRIAGEAFNIGGGAGNVVSLMELIDYITELGGKRPEVQSAEWRTEDQKYYVSDITKFRAMTGWLPAVSTREGIRSLWNWLSGALLFANENPAARETMARPLN